ncbi:hypothetical protein HAX54_031211, partial [Datura stramonium]|nr:hypothetical protein [Datura stramonium]
MWKGGSQVWKNMLENKHYLENIIWWEPKSGTSSVWDGTSVILMGHPEEIQALVPSLSASEVKEEISYVLMEEGSLMVDSHSIHSMKYQSQEGGSSSQKNLKYHISGQNNTEKTLIHARDNFIVKHRNIYEGSNQQMLSSEIRRRATEQGTKFRNIGDGGRVEEEEERR